MEMNLTKVTDGNFEQEILPSAKLVLLDFGATWCGPCKALEPVLAEIAREYADRVLVAKADIEDAPETARRYGVLSVPTVVFLKDGNEVGRFVGAERKDKITRQIEEMLASV